MSSKTIKCKGYVYSFLITYDNIYVHDVSTKFKYLRFTYSKGSFFLELIEPYNKSNKEMIKEIAIARMIMKRFKLFINNNSEAKVYCLGISFPKDLKRRKRRDSLL